MNNRCDFKGLDKSKRKQKIIDTAAALFHKKGYKSTTIDDVSKKLGITKAALYHYVKSKDEILSIIYNQTFENVFKDIGQISDMDLPPNEKLKYILRNHIKNIIIKDISMFSVFFSEENQLPEKDFRKIRKEGKKYTQIIEKIIEKGISEGIFRKADPKLQAYAMIGMCNWIYKWYKPLYSSYSPEDIADHFTDLLEMGYLDANRAGDSANLTTSGEAREKGISETKEESYGKLKIQCETLIELINEIMEV